MLLAIKNLNVEVDKKRIIKNLNLSLSKGEIFCLVGKNGAGKTTLSQTIMGIYKYKGEIAFEGKSIDKLSIDERARLGICLAWQKPISIEGLKVSDYIRLARKDMSEEEIKKALSFVGLDYGEYRDRQVDDKLSGGERKLIELASVLAMDSKLIILDEPDSGIDVVGIALIKRLIRNLKSKGRSILLITHREEMVKLSDRAGIICGGKITKQGSPHEIYDYLKKMCRLCEK